MLTLNILISISVLILNRNYKYYYYLTILNLIYMTLALNFIESLLILFLIAYIYFIFKNDFIKSEFIFILLINLLGMLILINTNFIIILILALELQTISLYVLTSQYSSKVGLLYVIIGSISSSILILGASLLYSSYGTDNLFIIKLLISDNDSILSILLISIALLFKLGIIPFHDWSINVYEKSNTVITLWIATIPKLTFTIILYRFIELNNNIINILILLLVFSIIFSNIIGLIQTKFKSLLIYSSINHYSLVILSILIAVKFNIFLGIVPIMFYIIQYTITSFNIFLILLLISNLTYIKSLSYLWTENRNNLSSLPLILSLTILIFSTAGIPPFIGFYSKYYLLMLINFANNIYLIIIILSMSVISLGYYLFVVRNLFKGFYDFNYLDNYSFIKANKGTLIISINNVLILLYFVNPDFILNILINQLC